MIKATVEFYDDMGFGLPTPCPEFTAQSVNESWRKGQAAFDAMGSLWPHCKTATIRCDVPGKLFPVTVDVQNPHFKKESE